MPIKNPRTFWDVVEVPYQHGAQKHRIYLLDLLQRKGVKSILDVGCGTGPIYHLLLVMTKSNTIKKRWNFDYKGVDYSPNFINWARKQFGDMFEVQDARSLKEPADSWDCVLLLHAIDHMKEFDQVIKEAARVARKYVCIVLWRGFQFPGTPTQVNDRNMICKEPDEEPWEDTYLLQFSKEELEKEFEKNNLVVEEIAEGEKLNSEHSKYNFLFLLRK